MSGPKVSVIEKFQNDTQSIVCMHLCACSICSVHCVTSLLHFCLRSVTMSVLNRICNHCLGNSSITNQPMLRMVLAWMLVQRVSGVEIGGWLILM